MKKKADKQVKRKKPMTARDREDARDVAIIRREVAKGGPTIGHNQLCKELGFYDLVIPALGRR